MAAGDFKTFYEGRALMLDTGWAAADTMKIALVTTATTPTQSTVTPALADFTEVTPGGNYTAGGISLGTWANFVTQSTSTVTFDSATDPSWAQNASNPNNARWGIVYNSTAAGSPAFGYVDLGAVIDMTTGALTITWNASGLATITG